MESKLKTTLTDGDIPAIPAGVKLTTLENGLTIIVREDHSAPVVSAQAWCMAGSVHEGKWLGAGLSHVLEHMLFKGTTTRPGSRIDQEVQEAGGYMNAFTSFDRTVYHIDVPNTGANVAIDILCDVMQNASLPPEEIEKEKQVIVREMDMNVDDPARRASRRLFETAYTKSPYRFTVIGYPDIFHELKRQDVVDYYREKYAPNNVFFVVAGDVNEPQVISQIRNAYAASRSRAIPPIVLPEEPDQMAPREIVEEAPIEISHFHFAWHIPELRHPDVPVLDVLAALLGHGRSSRLYQAVREKKGLVSSIDAWTYSPGNPGLLGMSATAPADKFSAARDEMLRVVEQMKISPVSNDELQKTVKQFVAGALAARKTMSGQAQDLGSNWLAANDLNFSERYLSAVKRATPADVHRVAREYLSAENRTLYALLPTGASPRESIVAQITTEHPLQKFELSNGLRLLVKEDHRLPFVEFRTVLRGGVLVETPGNSGITQLAGKMLLKGTATRSAEQIATTIESVGGTIDSYGGNNSFGLNSEVMSSDFFLGLDLLADVLLNPVFPKAELERERDVQLAAIREQKDQLLSSAFKAARRALFGERGYGLDTLGTENSLPRIGIPDLQTFHKKYAIPGNCVLAIYGDVDANATRLAVEKVFKSWQANGAMPPPATESSGSDSTRRLVEKHDKKQAVLVIAFPGTTMFDADRYALELLQESCSDLGSRLFMRIREQLGLAYYVGAQNLAGLVPGYFAFYVGTEPHKADLVEKELLNEAALLRSEGLTEEELSRSKAKIIGQRKIARQDLGHLAITTALDELYGLGYDYHDREDAFFEAVTLSQVKAAAQKYLRPEAAAIVIFRPREV
jgi:zinc protease